MAATVTGSGGFGSEYFHTMGTRTLTLGVEFPAPTIITLGGPSARYKRLQRTYSMPTDYSSSASLIFAASAVDKSVYIFASAGWFSGLSITLGLDASVVAGWDNNWLPAIADPVDYSVSGSGSAGTACSDGNRTISATRTGTDPYQLCQVEKEPTTNTFLIAQVDAARSSPSTTDGALI